MKITTIRISFNKLIRDDEGRLEETWKSMNYVFILIAYSFIGAIGAIGTGPPQNGGLQILYIWSDFVRFGKHLNISFQNFTLH